MDYPSQTSVDAELWNFAEQRAEEIIYCVQPNRVADKKREEILAFLRNLIDKKCGSKIFPFGSMPLRVYLPDGDIDVTALVARSREVELANKLVSLLQGPQQDRFFVRDVQYIHAQVEIVKCTVNGIAVDISFNQLAGLSTLCFLEKVDQLIGKNHLFKRSIILIKGWCYYESRILGAQNGLLSTYGLEVLILCIINLFHSTLHGPLAVLLKFLEYYSKFDWENYAVSLNGPVPKSLLSGSLGKPGTDGDQLLLNKEFLQTCREMFTVEAPDNETDVFPIKFLNIVDPVKSYNNLGRCVNRGSFYRIRHALDFGLRKFKEILLHPGEMMGQRLENFFKIILQRNGRGQRPDVDIPVSAFGTGKSDVSDLTGDYDKYYDCLLYGQQYHKKIDALSRPSTPPAFATRNGIALAAPFQPQYQNAFCYEPEYFVPTVPLCYFDSTKIPASAGYSGGMHKSRGTGPYIPNMTRLTYSRVAHAVNVVHQPEQEAHFNPGNGYKEICSGIQSSYKEKHLSTDHSNIKSIEGSGKIEVPSESKNNTVNLSLDEFPLLQDTGKPKTSLKARQASLPDVHQAGQSPSHWNTIEFGSVRQVLSPELPFLLKDKLAISSATTALEASHSGSSSKNQNKGLNSKAKPYNSLFSSTYSTAVAKSDVSEMGMPSIEEKNEKDPISEQSG